MNDVKKCPHCGKQLHSTARYCMFCMRSLQPKQNMTPKYTGGKKWGIAVGVLLLLVVLAAVCLRQCAPGDSGSDRNAPQEQTTQTPAEQTQPETTVLTEPQEPSTEPDRPQPSEPVQHQQPSTEPDQTLPQDTQPQQPPTTPTTAPTQPVCAHYYLAATCLAPMTCSRCGDTVGTVDTNAHKWQPVTAVVHHEEVGHYADQQVSYQKTVYLCFFCGYNQDGFDTMDDLRAHMGVHSNKLDYNYVMGCPDLLADTRQVWATRTEKQWVVDREAYDETVTVAYVCTVCSQKKDP